MRTTPVGVLFGCVFTLTITSSAFAFGRKGHETTGAIAAKLIVGTRAEKEVAKTLNRGEDLSTAAIWADCAKGLRYCRTSPTPEMQDYARRNPHHHGYHYSDIPFEEGVYRDNAVRATPEERTEVDDRNGSHSVWAVSLPRTYMPKGTVQVESSCDLPVIAWQRS